MNNFYINGPIFGTVTDNQDSENLGRIKVLISVMGEDIETDWISVMSFSAGNDSGAFFLPEIDDQVLVAFIGDNSDAGVALGAVWNETQAPPATGENSASDLNADGENNLRFIKSRSGHMIILDDKGGEEKLQIIAADGGSRFEILAKDQKMNIKTDKGFALASKGALGISAGNCKFKISKGLKIEANGVSLESKGQDLKLKAGNAISLEGSMVKLN